MPAPRERLLDLLEAFTREVERERVARWRRDPDARSETDLAARHAAQFGPRIQEWFEIATERGELADHERAHTAHVLRLALSVRERATFRSRLAELDASRVPYDSDHFAARALFDRALEDPRPHKRAHMLAALEPQLTERADRIVEDLAEREGANEPHAWLDAIDPVYDARVIALGEAAQRLLNETDDAWAELSERLAHREKHRSETFADLAFTLRARSLDHAVDPRSRWRRLAEILRPSELARSLERRVRTEPSSRARRAGLACVAAPDDVRVRGGREEGLASERSAMTVLGRALGVTLTHKASHPLLARPAPGTVGEAIGTLFAHLYTSRGFVEQVLGVRPGRTLTEIALAQEMFEVRTEAARALAHAELGTRAFGDAARTLFVRALGVEISEALAKNLTLETGEADRTRLRVLRFVPSLFERLRERYDEDFWRNPRLAPLVHGAAARGSAWSVEAWMQELEVSPDRVGPRVMEILSGR